MGKRRQNRSETSVARKRSRILLDDEQSIGERCTNEKDKNLPIFHVQQKDKIEQKVDLIIKDLESNSYKSLTFWGTGLGVEKTIAVVEELKRNYLKNGKKYTQETSIKTGDNNQPHLQIVLTILGENMQT